MGASSFALGKVLAVTAAGTFPANTDIVNEFADSAVAFQNSIRSEMKRSVGFGLPITESLFSIDFKGWFASKMFIPGTEDFISFTREPETKLIISKAITIPDWGVSVSLDRVSPEEMQLAVVRRYVMLANRYRRNDPTLTTEDRANWKMLLADSNYADFCQRTAPAVGNSGRRIREVSDGVEVVWDGATEADMIAGNFARQLAIVEDGERFSARVKFIDNKVASLSDVITLGEVHPVDIDELFGVAS